MCVCVSMKLKISLRRFKYSFHVQIPHILECCLHCMTAERPVNMLRFTNTHLACVEEAS